MKNEFLDLISSPLMNLDHTYRYSGTKLVEAESLSQHVVDTIMLGLKIIDRVNHIVGFAPGGLDTSLYVMKAVYHDLEEVITGDVPRPLKYHDEATLKSMRDVADEVARDLFNKEFYDSESHYLIWNDAKEDKEGYILKIVDTLVVALKVVKEVSLLNNFYMLRVAHEVSQYLEELRACTLSKDIFENIEVNEYIASILNDAWISMQKIISDHSGVMEEFNISGLSMI